VTSFPEYVTRTQITDAAKALGLPAEMVADVHISAVAGLEVTVHVRGCDGKIMIRGDEALTATMHVPIGHGPNGDQW